MGTSWFDDLYFFEGQTCGLGINFRICRAHLAYGFYDRLYLQVTAEDAAASHSGALYPDAKFVVNNSF